MPAQFCQTSVWVSGLQSSKVASSSVVYHSQLNKYQVNLLENIQKRTLRAIYGYELSYAKLLNKSELSTLEERRVKAFERFTTKTLKNKKYESWLPLKENIRTNRTTSTFKEEFAAGNRLYNSPVYTMRRLLNRSESISQIDLTGMFNNPFDNLDLVN